MPDTQSTIAAIATARGEAGVAVVRVSGPRAWEIARALFSKKEIVFMPGRFYHGWIVDPNAVNGSTGKVVDEVLLLIFKGPTSYTGEDVIEIHGHGGEAISHKILQLCVEAGARIAHPGEFTQRAFLNGKMDLTQAESVMDLVSARSERLMLQASSNLKNRSLGQYIDEISRPLIHLQTQIVASVDFPDEVDEPERGDLQVALNNLLDKVTRLKEGALRNRIVREGLKVAILGMPNSGKSSIFNTMLTSERSIVTEEAGTTRDVITETVEISGIPITLIDTAGIRETGHTIEMMGIERSWQAASEAQAVLYVYDAMAGIADYDREILSKLDLETTVVIANKQDLLNGKAQHQDSLKPGWLAVSAKTGQGLDQLYQRLETIISRMTQEQTGLTLALNQRQLACCEGVAENLLLAKDALSNPAYPLDLTTVPLTEALKKLDELMGRDTTEEVLTSVFQQFCVGK